MDQLKEGLAKADDKLGTVVDGGKAEVDIGKEETKIRDATKDIGKKVIECLDEGKEFDVGMIEEQYAMILESRKKIEDLKAQQEEYKAKLKD